MKKLILSLAMVVLLCGLTGCFEDDSKEKAKELFFINQSHVAVSVISLTIEWGSFALAPGQQFKLKDISNPDYRFEPSSVQEGSDSTVRYIVFVDAPPSSSE